MKESKPKNQEPKRPRGRPRKAEDENKVKEVKPVGRPLTPNKTKINARKQPEAFAINARFLQVIDKLVEQGVADSQFGVMVQMAGNLSVYYRLKENIESVNLPIYLLWAVVTKFNVDAEWLITGNGKMFKS
jgi:hypothetical protein